MTQEEYLKWFLEVVNQQYNGSVERLLNAIDRSDGR